MYAAMRKLTREKLGVAVSPHRFRDAAATYFVQEMPELATLARVVLNHASESMTRNYRTTAKQLTASRRVAKHLERSEEHTSELQSIMRISYAVFCLKKTKTLTHMSTC